MLGLFGFLWLVRGVLPPFLLSLVIVALLEPLVRKLGKLGLSRPIAVIVSLLLFFGLVGGLIGGSAVSIANQTHGVQEQIGKQIENIANSNPDQVWTSVDEFLKKNEKTLTQLRLPLTRQEIFSKYIEPNQKQIEQQAQKFLTGGVSGILNFAGQAFVFLLVPVFVFGLLMDLPNLRRAVARFIPPTIRGSTLTMVSDIGNVFEAYLRGLVTTIVLYTLVMGTVLGVIGEWYFIILALVAGVLYLIPVIGGIVSSVVIFLVIGFSGQTKGNLFQTDSSWGFALITVGAMFVVGFLYDSLVNPRIVGKAVKLNPVVSAFVVFSAAALFGLPGMVLAYPIAGAIKVILDRLVKFTGSTEGLVKLPSIPLRHRLTTET